MSASDVSVQYEIRLRELQEQGARFQSRNAMLATALPGVLILFAVLAVAAFHKETSLVWPLLLVPVMIAGVLKFMENRHERYRTWRLKCFYDRAMLRMTGNWASKGNSGEEFSDSGHPYSADLNLFGEGSLFELLCIARTSIGGRGLANYLLDAPSLDETRARQEAIRELQPCVELRETIATLGDFEFSEAKPETFEEWLDSPPISFPRLLPILAMTTAMTLLSLIVAGFALHRFADFAGPAETLIAIHIAIGLQFRARVNQSLEALRSLSNDTQVLREGLLLLEGRQFQSAKLRRIGEQVRNSAKSLRKLERLLGALQQKDKEWFFLPSRVLLMGTQLCIAIERWRRDHGDALRAWQESWAEFEALNALAAFAYEHPENIFPEFSDGDASFEARAMGHPTLPRESCVTNDVDLNRSVSFYVISGSNMSGKSTLLRAVGLNAVLAFAGAPVRAASLKLSGLSVFASLSVVDSLLNGKSKFRAEVDRLRQAIESKVEYKSVLFLVDEIFSGTNSRDRRIAAEGVVRTLVDRGGIGALSTHDLALTEIASAEGLSGVNVHMGSRDETDPFDFDYLLKPGVTKEANALAIARMAGVPV